MLLVEDGIIICCWWALMSQNGLPKSCILPEGFLVDLRGGQEDLLRSSMKSLSFHWHLIHGNDFENQKWKLEKATPMKYSKPPDQKEVVSPCWLVLVCFLINWSQLLIRIYQIHFCSPLGFLLRKRNSGLAATQNDHSMCLMCISLVMGPSRHQQQLRHCAALLRRETTPKLIYWYCML